MTIVSNWNAFGEVAENIVTGTLLATDYYDRYFIRNVEISENPHQIDSGLKMIRLNFEWIKYAQGLSRSIGKVVYIFIDKPVVKEMLSLAKDCISQIDSDRRLSE